MLANWRAMRIYLQLYGAYTVCGPLHASGSAGPHWAGGGCSARRGAAHVGTNAASRPCSWR